ncbi:MAG: hypothetical protein F4Y01_03445 [Gammaproteobacteria bacterium]|nr:hypothetical protein [Gammaproteobacteria bacterium]
MTDRTGRKSRGKTGWEHWETHQSRWAEWAAEEGIAVEFRVWSAFELKEMALKRLPPGAVQYWFDEAFLDDSWFAGRARISIRDLGSRYSPLAHVDTQVQRVYKAFVHHRETREAVTSAIARFRSEHASLTGDLESRGFASLAGLVCSALEELIGLRSDFLSPDTGWQVSRDLIGRWVGGLNRLAGQIQKIRAVAADKESTRGVARRIEVFGDAVARMLNAINGDVLRYSGASTMLLLGQFGTGKSHAMGKILESSIAEGRPAVLFLGQQFNDGNPRNQMMQFAGLPSGFAWHDLLDALNAASESSGQIGLVLIDAINEGAGVSVWPNHMAGILQEIAERSSLRLIVSCRSEYKEWVWPESVEASVFQLRDFTEREFQHACKQLLDDEGIARPVDSFLPPGFYNPLILSTACVSVKAQGLAHFPGSLAGLSEFVDLYVNGIAHDVGRRHGLDGAAALISRGLLALASEMLDGPVAEPRARQVLNDAARRVPPRNTDWLEALLSVGALRLDPHPTPPAWEPQAQVVRFSFQIHEEEFAARALLRRAGSCVRPFDVGKPLEFVRRSVETGTASHRWRGALMALSVIWPQEHGGELVEILPPCSEAHRLYTLVRACMQEGLLWRKPEHVSARTTALLDQLGDANAAYAVLVKFVAVVDHPWNGLYLHERLDAFEDMAARDAMWTVALNEPGELSAAALNHVVWMLAQTSRFANPLVGELAAVGLIWFLSTTNRNLRDQATKALVHLFRLQPDVMPKLLQRFGAVDDLYVLERVLASVYGACCGMRGQDVGLAAEAVYDQVFCQGDPPAHLLVRDFALGVIERATFLDVVPQHVDVAACKPPHTTKWPLEFRSNAEVDARAEAVGDTHGTIARSCTTEYGRGVGGYGDFGRYVLESRARHFLPVALTVEPPPARAGESGWNGELIGNWTAWRAYELGWRHSLFPKDGAHGEYVSRSRGRTERIGKKYQWIAMYELLGTMSDHVWCERRLAWDEVKRYHSALDVPFCRDVDPTVVAPEVAVTPVQFAAAGLRFEGLRDVSRPNWPFAEEALLDMRSAAMFTGDDGRRWYRLYAHARHDALEDRRAPSYLSFARIVAVCVPVEELASRVARWKGKGRRFFFDTELGTLTDEEFLLELDWRQTQDWNDAGKPAPYFASDRVAEKAGDFRGTVCQYRWEQGRDGALPEGAACYVPVAWAAAGAELTMDPECPSVFRRSDGAIGSFSFDETQESRGNAGCLICADSFDRLLSDRGLTCVWTLSGERMMSRGARGGGRRRSYAGLAWFEAGQVRSESWWSDSGA